MYFLVPANTVTALRLVSAIAQQPSLSVTKHMEAEVLAGRGEGEIVNGKWIMDNG